MIASDVRVGSGKRDSCLQYCLCDGAVLTFLDQQNTGSASQHLPPALPPPPPVQWDSGLDSLLQGRERAEGLLVEQRGLHPFCGVGCGRGPWLGSCCGGISGDKGLDARFGSVRLFIYLFIYL